METPTLPVPEPKASKETNLLDPVDLLLAKKRLNEVLREQLRVAKEFAISRYRPHPKQAAFHSAGDFKGRYVRAGNRFGKSTMGIAEDVSWLLGYRPWLRLDDPNRTKGIPSRPVKGLVIVENWDKVREVFTEDRGAQLGKIWQFIPLSLVKSKRRNQNGVIEHLELHNGSTLSFNTVRSYKTDKLSAESSDWDFIHVDEPCPEKMFAAHARGLMDRNGSYWFTLTPLSEPWIDDKFLPRSRTEQMKTDGVHINGTKWAVRGKTDDNPTLSEEAKLEFFSSLDKEEAACRRLGIPLSRSGIVFKEFDHDRHILEDVPKGWTNWLSPPFDWPVGYALDPHPQTPHAVLFWTCTPTGHIIFFHEIFEHCLLEQLGHLITAALGGRKPAWELVDPSAFVENPVTGTTWADELAPFGLFPEPGSKDLSGGLVTARSALGHPDRLLFSPHLTETLWEFDRYVWDPNKPNRPRDRDDHMMENFRRVIELDPRYFDPNEKTTPVADQPFGSADLQLVL